MKSALHRSDLQLSFHLFSFHLFLTTHHVECVAILERVAKDA